MPSCVTALMVLVPKINNEPTFSKKKENTIEKRERETNEKHIAPILKMQNEFFWG